MGLWDLTVWHTSSLLRVDSFQSDTPPSAKDQKPSGMPLSL
jgi:hypothetical protein